MQPWLLRELRTLIVSLLIGVVGTGIPKSDSWCPSIIPSAEQCNRLCTEFSVKQYAVVNIRVIMMPFMTDKYDDGVDVDDGGGEHI